MAWWTPSARRNSRHSALRQPNQGLRFELLEHRQLLAALTINSVLDNTASDHELTLREATALVNNAGDANLALGRSLTIEEAAQIEATEPFGTNDAIDFSITGTITLDSLLGEIPIMGDLTVNGPGAGQLAIDGGNANRVFNVDANGLLEVEISGLTIQNGNSILVGGGGGIRNNENLTLRGVSIAQNSAIAGGGIFHGQNTLRIIDSVIWGNNASGDFDGGGGILTLGGMVLQNSTLSGNTGDLGGAILSQGGGVSLFNSTVADNTANVAGGAIYSFTGISLTNSVVSGNAAPTSPDLDVSTVNSSYSLIQDPAGATINDLGGTITGVDPMLGPLQDNGGPTETHAVGIDSPALNAGDPSAIAGVGDVPVFDQRGTGFERVSFGRIDIGAYELQVPASLVVDTAADESDGDFSMGDLSLREATELANIRPGADTITFATGLNGATINLGLGQLVISEDVTVTGPGASNLTVDAGNASRVLQITAGMNHLSGLTFSGGNADRGGGIRNEAAAATTLNEMVISGNTATVSSFEAGGGIFNQGDLKMTRSSLIGNRTTVGDGGGIWNSDSLTITDSTLSGNSAREWGGAVFNYGGTLNITNATISANKAGNGPGGAMVITGGATVAVEHSTIVRNSATGEAGGIHVRTGTVNIGHSIVSGNSGSSGNEIHVFAGTVNLDDYNLIGESSQTTAQALVGVSAGASDVTATSNGSNPTALASILDTTLADNGGPTATHAIGIHSPAINAGDPSATAGVGDVPLFDQRGNGFERVFGGIDIGAYEFQGPAELIVDISADESDGDVSPGDLSLREAIELANISPGPDTITFAAGLDGSTITLGGSALEITESVSIDASSLPSGVTVDANGGFQVIRITPFNGTVALTNLTITGSSAGGGVDSEGPANLDIVDSTITGNAGGGIESYGGNVSLTRSAVSNNTSRPGIFAYYGGDVQLIDSTVSGNNAGPGAGGGIFAYEGVSLIRSTVSGNNAGNRGGGIWAGDVMLVDSTVSGNSTSSAGSGGIFGTTVTLTRSTVSGNSTSGGGGGIEAGTITLNESTVSGNHADGNGGGILATNPLTVHRSTITDNHALGSGGGLWVTSGDDMTLNGSIVAANTAAISNPDLGNTGGSYLVNYSLIGDTSGTAINATTGTGNWLNVPALLGPLQNNGGLTETHALLDGSLAVNHGDPDAVAGQNDVPLDDQRGVGFDRVREGRIDIGAYEAAPFVDCDFDDDGDCDVDDIDTLIGEIVAGTNDLTYDLNDDLLVDLADRDQWLVDAGARHLPSGNPYLLGDANLDGVVDGLDFIAWNNNKFIDTGRWSQGDWNADGITDGLDFVIWNNNKFQTAAGAGPLFDQVFASLASDEDEETDVVAQLF